MNPRLKKMFDYLKVYFLKYLNKMNNTLKFFMNPRTKIIG